MERQAIPCLFTLERLESRFVLAADLVIDSVIAPAAVSAGAVMDVSWVVRNAGDAPAGVEFGWWDGVYLSLDGTLDEQDIYLVDVFSELEAPLAPGQAVAMTAQVWVPLDGTFAPGEYRLIVAADLGETEPESDETNNTRVSGTLQMNIPPLPDLSVSQIDLGLAAQAGAQFGDTITISWTIANGGPGSTLADWSDAVYLSGDAALDGGDLWVEVVEVTTPLAVGPGGTATMEAVVRLPLDAGLAAGAYHVIVVADGYSTHPETDEENNALASAPIAVSSAPPADLVIEQVVATPSAEFGHLITITWTVRNIGAGAAGWWSDELYLSSDDVIDPQDILLEQAEGASPGGGMLAPGESVQMQASVRLPDAGALPAGSYRLLMLTDAWDSVAESNEHNNAGPGAPIAIADPQSSDLAVESGIGPATGQLGQAIEVSWVVRNLGTGGVGTWSWADGVYLSLDGALTADDVQVGWAEAAWMGALQLNPGEAVAATTSAWLPQDGSLQPGTYHVIVVTDVDGRTLDADRGNNTAAIGTIEVGGEIGPGGWGGPELGGMAGSPSLGAMDGDAKGRGLESVAGSIVAAPTPDQGGLSPVVGAATTGGEALLYTWAGPSAGAKVGSRVLLRVATTATGAPSLYVR